MWGGMNKRVFPRANYPCRVKVISLVFSHTFETHTENIGIGGICVILEKQLNRFSDVDVELLVDNNDEPIRSRGRVVWVIKRAQYIKHKPNCFDTGIEFSDISSRDSARISSLVDKLREQEAQDAQD